MFSGPNVDVLKTLFQDEKWPFEGLSFRTISGLFRDFLGTKWEYFKGLSSGRDVDFLRTRFQDKSWSFWRLIFRMKRGLFRYFFSGRNVDFLRTCFQGEKWTFYGLVFRTRSGLFKDWFSGQEGGFFLGLRGSILRTQLEICKKVAECGTFKNLFPGWNLNFLMKTFEERIVDLLNTSLWWILSGFVVRT